MSLPWEWRRNTAEYVEATYRSSVNLTGVPVELNLATPGTTPATGWLPAVWQSITPPDPAVPNAKWVGIIRTSDIVTFSLAAFPRGTYEVLVRLTDTPEVPIHRAYLGTITG